MLQRVGAWGGSTGGELPPGRVGRPVVAAPQTVAGRVAQRYERATRGYWQVGGGFPKALHTLQADSGGQPAPVSVITPPASTQPVQPSMKACLRMSGLVFGQKH